MRGPPSGWPRSDGGDGGDGGRASPSRSPSPAPSDASEDSAVDLSHVALDSQAPRPAPCGYAAVRRRGEWRPLFYFPSRDAYYLGATGRRRFLSPDLFPKFSFRSGLRERVRMDAPADGGWRQQDGTSGLDADGEAFKDEECHFVLDVADAMLPRSRPAPIDAEVDLPLDESVDPTINVAFFDTQSGWASARDDIVAQREARGAADPDAVTDAASDVSAAQHLADATADADLVADPADPPSSGFCGVATGSGWTPLVTSPAGMVVFVYQGRPADLSGEAFGAFCEQGRLLPKVRVVYVVTPIRISSVHVFVFTMCTRIRRYSYSYSFWYMSFPISCRILS